MCVTWHMLLALLISCQCDAGDLTEEGCPGHICSVNPRPWETAPRIPNRVLYLLVPELPPAESGSHTQPVHSSPWSGGRERPN